VILEVVAAAGDLHIAREDDMDARQILILGASVLASFGPG
jgi:hypothetical protein